MRSWTPPTPEDILKLAALAARPENRAYFFDRLQNPLWVSPLREGGFFRDPPAPVEAGEPGYVRFPRWHEGQYLVRMAPQDPQAVAKVIEETSPNENPAVSRDVLEAIASLPDPELRVVASKVSAWVASPHPDFFADEARAAIVRLLEIGKTRQGIDAAKSLLAIRPDPRRAEKLAASDAPFRPTLDPAARISDWQYARVLETLTPPLVDHAGLDGLRLLATLLDDALQLSSWSEADDPAALSYIWRPAIEDHPQNTVSDARGVLTSGLRDIALRLAARSTEDLERVMRELDNRSLLHRRIALHVAASAANAQGDTLRQKVGDRALFDDYRVRHEYATLLRNRFADVGDDVQNRVLGWIAAGPDLDAYRARRTQNDGSPPSDDDVDLYARIWKRDRYSIIADQLSGAHAEGYAQLVTDLGEADHADFVAWSASWTGPDSPTTADEMLAMTLSEVVDYLRIWTPADTSGWPPGPSIEGLGRVLAEVVQRRPTEYASIASSFADLDPTYVRNYFMGLEASVRESKEISWDQPMELAISVVQHAFEEDEDLPHQERDPGWRWCRREIASLLRLGLAAGPASVPFGLRKAVWQVVERLTDDPNPSPEHERRYGGENMDPFSLSINTNRGTAMHAVVEYALWTRRGLEGLGVDVSNGLAAMPEVRAVLERHLDAALEPSLAVRAVYGRWLPWLHLLDAEWLTANLVRIFPESAEGAALRDAAWAAYIGWCPPYDSVYRAVRAYYDAAIDRMPTAVTGGGLGRERVDVKLGEHLATFYWRRVVDEAVIDEFFGRSDDSVASDVMQFVGRSLLNAPGELSDRIRERIEMLWDRRFVVIAANPDKHKLEARAFGPSFASGKLDQTWSLEMLERAIRLSGASSPGHLVVERLVAVASDHPKVAVHLLMAMLEGAERDWDYLGWKDEAKVILSQLQTTVDPAVADDVNRVVDYFVQRGEQDFRQFTVGA
jgi:hypothetical protein